MLFAVAIVAAVLALAAIGPAVSPYPPDAFVARPLLAPSAAHLLGTNSLGQDLLAQFLAGAQPSVLAGLIGGALSTALALAVGIGSALGRRADAVLRATTDVFLAVPHLPLLLLVVALVGSSLQTIVLALGALSWPAFARVVRAQTRAEMAQGHVLAARALGVSPARIVWRHVLPGLAPIVVAKLVLTVQYVVLAEASLAFLGLGDPSLVSWGGMVQRAMQYGLLFASPLWIWWLLPPVVAIAAFVASLATLGTTLDERTNPALRAPRAG